MVQSQSAPNVDGTKCRGCGSFVSARFIRVFGDNEDRVYGCHECMSTQELFDGGSVNST